MNGESNNADLCIFVGVKVLEALRSVVGIDVVVVTVKGVLHVRLCPENVRMLWPEKGGKVLDMQPT